MYQKKSHGWYKHKDFILLDLLYIFFGVLYLRTIFEITLILVLPTMEFTVMQ